LLDLYYKKDPNNKGTWARSAVRGMNWINHLHGWTEGGQAGADDA